MGFLAKSAAVIAVLGAQSVFASPAAAPNPAITPAPVVRRGATKTLGYYTEGGKTSWESWLYDADSVSYTTSGNYFRRCSVGINCVFYTSCSSGWMVGQSGASTYCGAPTATGTFSANFCSWHVLQPSQSAPGGGISWFWCDQAPLTGYTFFAKAPAAVATATPSAVSSAASSARVTPANTRSGASTTTDTETPTTTTSGAASSTSAATDDNKSSTPVGAIAGGVVGGVAVLGAIAFAIIFIMRRDKAKKAAAPQAAPLMGAQPAYNQQPQGYPQTTEYYGAGGAPPGVGAYASEQKPQAPAYYPPQQQQYPMGPYDPHVSQTQYQAPSPQPGAAELGAPVTFAPQELPAGQAAPKR